mmetsp:Transcript_118851/g.341267  ORF Transcript_118851/g.341267 Transcript_118851/m.341267 type:complete len:347 (+) Transcript_118851:449-1489(+)
MSSTATRNSVRSAASPSPSSPWGHSLRRAPCLVPCHLLGLAEGHSGDRATGTARTHPARTTPTTSSMATRTSALCAASPSPIRLRGLSPRRSPCAPPCQPGCPWRCLSQGQAVGRNLGWATGIVRTLRARTTRTMSSSAARTSALFAANPSRSRRRGRSLRRLPCSPPWPPPCPSACRPWRPCHPDRCSPAHSSGACRSSPQTVAAVVDGQATGIARIRRARTTRKTGCMRIRPSAQFAPPRSPTTPRSGPGVRSTRWRASRRHPDRRALTTAPVAEAGLTGPGADNPAIGIARTRRARITGRISFTPARRSVRFVVHRGRSRTSRPPPCVGRATGSARTPRVRIM